MSKPHFALALVVIPSAAEATRVKVVSAERSFGRHIRGSGPSSMRDARTAKRLLQTGSPFERFGRAGHTVRFKLFFPRPPYGGVEYRAAKTKSGYNFVGAVLGHGGQTLQKIQRQSGCRIEIHDEHGNLNGAHPDAGSPELHALVLCDNVAKLEKAVELLKQALEPINSKYESFKVEPNGMAILTPVQANQGSDVVADLGVPGITSPLTKKLMEEHGISGTKPGMQLSSCPWQAPAPWVTPSSDEPLAKGQGQEDLSRLLASLAPSCGPLVNSTPAAVQSFLNLSGSASLAHGGAVPLGSMAPLMTSKGVSVHHVSSSVGPSPPHSSWSIWSDSSSTWRAKATQPSLSDTIKSIFSNKGSEASSLGEEFQKSTASKDMLAMGPDPTWGTELKAVYSMPWLEASSGLQGPPGVKEVPLEDPLSALDLNEYCHSLVDVLVQDHQSSSSCSTFAPSISPSLRSRGSSFFDYSSDISLSSTPPLFNHVETVEEEEDAPPAEVEELLHMLRIPPDRKSVV